MYHTTHPFNNNYVCIFAGTFRCLHMCALMCVFTQAHCSMIQQPLCRICWRWRCICCSDTGWQVYCVCFCNQHALHVSRCVIYHYFRRRSRTILPCVYTTRLNKDEINNLQCWSRSPQGIFQIWSICKSMVKRKH